MRQTLRTFLAEGVLFGVVGSLAASRSDVVTFSVAAVSRTVDTLYVASHADRVSYDPIVLLKAFLIGVVAAVIAALVPALEAAATPPATTMRAQGYERRLSRTARRALRSWGWVCCCSGMLARSLHRLATCRCSGTPRGC